MKKSDLVMKRLWLSKERFVKSDNLKVICKELGINYETLVNYLLSRHYLIRIFKGIFYVKSPEEIKIGKVDKSTLEMVANGLQIKGVNNWYFGLYTAILLNNITHEYFTVNYVINDKIFRAKEINIAENKFKFIKIKPSLIFGIKEKNGIRYSDLEKTILDFVYLWRYRNISEEKILIDVSEFVENASKKKLLEYSKKYPKTVRRIVDELI